MTTKRTTALRLAAVAAALAVAASQAAHSKTPEEVRAACRAEGRPCVGLVLSGGGARGFAHVGVIRVLEDLGVKVDVITGTSMGSMVGGAYAAGFTLKELEETVLEVDWSKMLAPRPQRDILPWRRKNDDYKSLSNSSVEIAVDGTLRLPQSFVPSEELELFLSRKTAPVSKVQDLSMLAIPFAAPATNLVTGRRVVMQKDCTLGQAMRASMSVPGAFAPAQYKGELLVDGGLLDNLPVELAREMGADVIIAVNVGTPLSSRDELGNVVGVMAQMVNLLTEQNVTASLAGLTERDILIRPDLTDYTSADLNKSREIMEAGEAAGRAAAGRLRGLAVKRDRWEAWNEARTKVFTEYRRGPKVISDVQVAQAPDAAVPADRIIERAGIRAGDRIGRRGLDEAARAVWADGYFDSVTYRLDPGHDGTATLVFEPKDKNADYSSVRLGGSVETDFDSTSTFNLLFAHTWHLLNTWGGEWRNEIQVGETQRFLSEFYQPLGRTLPIFVQPSLSYERATYDIYEGDDSVAQWRNSITDAKVLFGWEIARLGYAGISGGWMSASTKTVVGRDTPPWREKSAPYMGAELMLDTLDSVSFPTEGFRLSAEGKLTNHKIGFEKRSHHFTVNALVPWTVGRWTTTLEGEIGRATAAGSFRLGGASRMVGAQYGRWSGARLEYGSVTVARNVTDFVPMPVSVWVGVKAESGRTWNDGGNSVYFNSDGSRDWHRSGSVFIGVDSLFGPMFLTFGHTKDEGSGIYFRWGYRH